MPIYEYECRKCGETIEAIQKMSDPDLKKHAGCGGTLTKLLSMPSVQVKGTVDNSERHLLKQDAYQQQLHNEAKAREKKKKTAPIVMAPSAKRGKSKSK
jgi:putative FmdB family regulatory protein